MTLRGANQGTGRPYNRRIVLETVRTEAPITRSDIAGRIGLSVQTVSTIIRELEAQGFLLRDRGQPKGRGYPAPTYAINPEGGFAVGVHVTPRGLEAGLVNLAGELVDKAFSAMANSTPQNAFAEINKLVARLRLARPSGRILGVGMAMPGPFDVDSMSFVGPTTMQGWQGVPLQENLQAATGLPAFIEVDMAASALGERLYGAGKNFRHFYYLYFGVGLGGCMVQSGETLRGAFGNAGELGHIPIVPDGDPCPCGNRGCLERYVSLDAYERRAPLIGEAAWIEEIAPVLRAAIVTIENLFDPETIVLGGVAPRPLVEQLAAAMADLPNSVAARRARRASRVILSDRGEDAVLLGAAALAVNGILSPRSGPKFAPEHKPADFDPIMNGHAKGEAA